MLTNVDPGLAIPIAWKSSFRLCFSSVAMPLTWLSPKITIQCCFFPDFTFGNTMFVSLLLLLVPLLLT
jgi:hypothetical protein